MMAASESAFFQAESVEPTTGSSNAEDRCKRCLEVGCDVRILDCGCTLHARCAPLLSGFIPMATCPSCHSPVRQLYLIEMSFSELDEARKVAASVSSVQKRGQKRMNATIARINPQASTQFSLEDSGSDDLRTGRWTPAEMAFCDALVEKFEAGQLPLVDGTKLSDFLSGMLKSKQSRLTKKMKNAKLSAKTFVRTTGYISDDVDAQAFAKAESELFASIPCTMERAEIRFHMQKEWREHFSSFCVSISQPLDADQWLSSVDELDRRMSRLKDQARMDRRKLMMGQALTQDSLNQEQGVFIEQSMYVSSQAEADEIVNMLTNGGSKKSPSNVNMARRLQSAPFLGKTIAYIQRHGVPFEHVDAWVPSFVPVQDGSESKCRLCFAGCATADVRMVNNNALPLTGEDRFDWLAFGEYSAKFSFDVGCGLPGRVYQHGVPSWEQNVENAPHHHFERCGGASQWKIKTVVALAVPSPSVGRIVVLLYSRSDRTQDQDMVTRMTAELTKLVPNPKWKLVVDIGTPSLKTTGSTMASSYFADTKSQEDLRAQEILSLVGEYTPSSSSSPFAPYLPGFMTLRVMLMKSNRTPKETELLRTLIGSYSSYIASGKSSSDIAWLLARDCMHLSQQSSVTTMRHSRPGVPQGSVEQDTAFGELQSNNGAETNAFVHNSLLQMQGQGMGVAPASQQMLPSQPLPLAFHAMPPAPGGPPAQNGATY